jgi:hypothetical protein
MVARIERLVTFRVVYNDVTNVLSVVVMAGDKDKCGGLVLGKWYSAVASPLHTGMQGS